MKEKTPKIILLALAAIIIVVITINIIQSFAQVAVEEEAQPIPIEVIEVARTDITEVTTLTSVANAKEDIAIIPKVGGRVERVAAAVGDKVSRGQLLVQLEQSELLVQLKQAEAGLALVKANESAVMAKYEDARINLERMEKLYSEGAVSAQQLEGARLQYEASKPASFYAQIQQAKAAVESAKIQLANTVIISPIDGIITAMHANIGAMAGPNAPIAVVMNLDKMEVSLGVVEQYIKNLRVGDEVYVKITAAGSELFAGVIKSVSSATDAMVRTFPIIVEIDNPQHEIKSGMFAEVQLPTMQQENVLFVPIDAVENQRGRLIVYVVEDGRAISRTVVTGLKDDKHVEIISGLQEGEVVITKGQSVVTDGDRVEVQDGER